MTKNGSSQFSTYLESIIEKYFFRKKKKCVSKRPTFAKFRASSVNSSPKPSITTKTTSLENSNKLKEIIKYKSKRLSAYQPIYVSIERETLFKSRLQII